MAVAPLTLRGRSARPKGSAFLSRPARIHTNLPYIPAHHPPRIMFVQFGFPSVSLRRGPASRFSVIRRRPYIFPNIPYRVSSSHGCAAALERHHVIDFQPAGPAALPAPMAIAQKNAPPDDCPAARVEM